MRRLLTLPLAALALLAACKTGGPSSEMEIKPVRVAGMEKSEKAIAYGDCNEALRRAKAKPDMDVDRIPTPDMKPRPFRRVPPGALRKDGSATIKVDVIVDTLGRADMKTLKVVEVSNDWFVKDLKTVMPRWRFSPAVVAGCKVPRVYHFMASTPPRRG